MNQTLEPELLEAYALAKSNNIVIHSIEIRHESIEDSLFFVQGFRSQDLTVDGDVKTFQPLGFNLTLPATDDGGIQELTLTLDNVGNQVSDFCEQALGYSTPVEIFYRPYLSSDKTNCLMDPALRLFLLDVQITVSQVSGRAVPVDFLNISFPSEDYVRSRFPGLSSF